MKILTFWTTDKLPPTILHTYSPMKTEQTECSETLAFKLQKPLDHPEESTQVENRLPNV
jgi:hypothetical protein